MSSYEFKAQGKKPKKKGKKGRIEDEVLNGSLLKFTRLIKSKDIEALAKNLKITSTFKNYQEMEVFNESLFKHYSLDIGSRKAFRLIICYIFNQQINREDYPQILLLIVQK